jgi:rubrerythrin
VIVVEHSFCLTCGYVLYGIESGVCPECGTAIPESKSEAISKATNTDLHPET